MHPRNGGSFEPGETLRILRRPRRDGSLLAEVGIRHFLGHVLSLRQLRNHPCRQGATREALSGFSWSIEPNRLYLFSSVAGCTLRPNLEGPRRAHRGFASADSP